MSERVMGQTTEDWLRAALAEATVALKDCRGVLQSCAEDTAGTPTEEFFLSRVRYCDIVIAKAEREW